MDQVGKRDIKELNSKLESLGASISKKADVSKEDVFYYVNKNLSFFRYDGYILPTLRKVYDDEKIRTTMKKVVVDMGAVKFVVKGADIMRPGIKDFDDRISRGDIVIVVDESHAKPLSIGISNFSAQDFKEKNTGKAIKNLHYVGDDIWNRTPNP